MLMRQRRVASANMLLGRTIDGSRCAAIHVLVGSTFFLGFDFYPSWWCRICRFYSSISSSFQVFLPCLFQVRHYVEMIIDFRAFCTQYRLF